MPPIITADRLLVCPNCPTRVVERGGNAPIGGGATRMHECRGLAGMLAPLVLEGVRCKVEAVERDDYVGGEVLRYDGNGRPVMAVETTRDDGTDRIVFAPAATTGSR